MFELSSLDIVAIVLAFAAATLLGGAVQLFYERSQAPLRKRIGNDPGRVGAAFAASDSSQSLVLGLLSAVGNVAGGKDASSKLRLQLIQAGLSSPSAVHLFLGGKMMLLCFSLLAALLVFWPMKLAMLYKMFAIFAVPGVAFFIPNIVLDLMRRSRAQEVQRNLPNMVDLLGICVSGGMGMDAAWNAVTEQTRLTCRTLADEMAFGSLEMQLGEDRGAAIRHMADRTGSQDLKSLVAVLVQSERFGTSQREALEAFAVSLRQERSVRAEEAAEKMAVTMLFPMIIFIFPVELIVAVGPAVILISEALGTK